AVQYLRREAIKTLADAQNPAVAVNKKDNKVVMVEGVVVVPLLKILAGETDPPPSLTEKYEAAMGVLGFKDLLDYQPDVGYYLAGQALTDYVDAYRKDYAGFGGGKATRPPALPWKYNADRLDKVVKDLAKGSPAAKELANALEVPVQKMSKSDGVT